MVSINERYVQLTERVLKEHFLELLLSFLWFFIYTDLYYDSKVSSVRKSTRVQWKSPSVLDVLGRGFFRLKV